jgi:hypothetical protein
VGKADVGNVEFMRQVDAGVGDHVHPRGGHGDDRVVPSQGLSTFICHAREFPAHFRGGLIGADGKPTDERHVLRILACGGAGAGGKGGKFRG